MLGHLVAPSAHRGDAPIEDRGVVPRDRELEDSSRSQSTVSPAQSGEHRGGGRGGRGAAGDGEAASRVVVVGGGGGDGEGVVRGCRDTAPRSRRDVVDGSASSPRGAGAPRAFPHRARGGVGGQRRRALVAVFSETAACGKGLPVIAGFESTTAHSRGLYFTRGGS